MAPWFNLLQILSWKPPPTYTHTKRGCKCTKGGSGGEGRGAHFRGQQHNKGEDPRDQERVGGGQAREHFKEAWERKKGGWGTLNAFPAFPSPTKTPAPQRAKLKNACSTCAHPPPRPGAPRAASARAPRPGPRPPPPRGPAPSAYLETVASDASPPLPGMEAQGNSPPRRRRRRRLQPPPK